MPLTFHIIYVPGSVGYLLSFVDSLLQWSEYSFRLVSNGCPEEEQRLMRTYCRSNPRLEYLALPTVRPAAHRDALNYLQAICTEETFCFMDSDIFACGPFLEKLDVLRTEYSAVFAGAPLWLLPEEQTMPPDVHVAIGEYSRGRTGLPLGGTFFGVYDNRLLSDFIRSTGLGFQICHWSDLPSWLQAWCADREMTGCWFDTGKTLNLGLQYDGHDICVLDSPNLVHLGGLSFVARQRFAHTRKGRQPLIDELHDQARNLYVGLYRRSKHDPILWADRLPFRRRRKLYEPYFADLLSAQVSRKPPPHLPNEDHPLIRQRAHFAAEQIPHLYRDFVSRRLHWEQAAGGEP